MIDKYTKFVFTVIAVCLTVIVLRDVLKSDAQKVQIVSVDRMRGVEWDDLEVYVRGGIVDLGDKVEQRRWLRRRR